MKTKSFPAHIKAAGTTDGLEEGQFEAIVSVFGNVDTYGDVVMPGAFAETLEAWTAKGDPIPVIWSHRWSDPEMHVGYVLEAEEREKGLWVKAQLDLDMPTAKTVNRLLKGRRVTQFSFAYDEVETGWGKRDDRDVYELRKLDVIEVGPTLLGVNQDTELLAAKSLNQAAKDLAEAALRQAMATKTDTPEPDVEATDDRPDPDDGSDAADSGTPIGPSPASVRALADLTEAEASV